MRTYKMQTNSSVQTARAKQASVLVRPNGDRFCSIGTGKMCGRKPEMVRA